MGLLDDAIREHLELKRRRGADPAEIERAEREALGPVRRGPEEIAPAGGFGDASLGELGGDVPAHDDLPPLSEHPLGYEDGEEYWEEEHDYAPPGPPGDEFGPTVPPVSADSPPPRLAFQAPPEDPYGPEPLGPDPHEDDVVPSAHPDDLGRSPGTGAGEETVEYRLEPDDEDVLEETPDFLQDAPEHDRLWFEQRPPRDFDFDN